MDAASWKYVENQFDSVTRKSREAMDKILQDHAPKLSDAAAVPGADPLLVTLAADFAPVKNMWDKEYGEWKNSGANYSGSTVSLEVLLSNLAISPGPAQISKIEEWDSRIRVQAPKGTPAYVTLLPQGRAPFSSASRESIIGAVKGLGERLAEQTTKPLLVALGVEVTAYYTQMKNARDAQQGMEGAQGTESAEVSPARIAAARALYGNLGMLMYLYRNNPTTVASFFDLDTLRPAAKKEPAPPVPPGP